MTDTDKRAIETLNIFAETSAKILDGMGIPSSLRSNVRKALVDCFVLGMAAAKSDPEATSKVVSSWEKSAA